MSKLSKLNKIKTNRKKSKIRKEDLKKLRINSFANKTYRTIDNFLGCIGFMNMKEYKTALHIGDYDIDNIFTKGFNLEQNYPNPFNSHTWIKYSVHKLSNITQMNFPELLTVGKYVTIKNNQLGVKHMNGSFLNEAGTNIECQLYLNKFNSSVICFTFRCGIFINRVTFSKTFSL